VKVGNKVIGLTIGQRSMLVAEVSQRGGKPTMQQYAEFVYPEGVGLADADKLGPALAQFWKQQRFGTREVIIGLPAKQLITRRKEVPAASEAIASSTLRLQAESEFSAELDNLVMDYAGSPSASEATTVLLIATNRKIIEQCEALAKAAGLKVLAITSTTAALGRATSRLPGGDGLVVNMGNAGAELIVQHGQDPAHLRHLNSPSASSPEAIGALAGEIRRIMASIPRNGTPQTVALWMGPALSGDASTGSILEQRLAMPVTSPEVSNLLTSENREANAYAAPAAVALTAIDPKGLPVDFLHSRLAPPPPPRVSTTTVLLVVLGLAIVGFIGYAFYDLGQRQSKVDRYNKLIAGMSKQVDQAKLHKTRLDDAASRLPRDKYYTDVWSDLSDCFPRQSNTIWAMHLSNSSNDRTVWTLEGKSTTEGEVRTLAERMNLMTKPAPGNFPAGQAPQVQAFESAVVMNLRADANSRGMYSFTIKFTYR